MLKLSIEINEKVIMVVGNRVVGSIKHTNEDGNVAVTIHSYEKERTDVKFLKKENVPDYFDKYEEREKNKINVVVKKQKKTFSLKRKRR